MTTTASFLPQNRTDSPPTPAETPRLALVDVSVVAPEPITPVPAPRRKPAPTPAHVQARAEAAQTQIEQLRAEVEQGHMALALARASAEQSYRATECLRVAFQSLRDHLTQPSFAMDTSGRVTHWNLALARLTGVAASNAEGRPLSDVFASAACQTLCEAARALVSLSTLHGVREAVPPILFTRIEAGNAGNLRLTLIPLYRTPACIESVLALAEPEA